MPATGLSVLDMRIWFAGNGLECFRYADLDNFNDNRLNYPEGAFSRLLDFCIVPGFWINLKIFELSYTIFGSISMSLGSVFGLATG